jgi:hypothetical protein
LDTEWLLSTLFDASLLSTLKAAGNGGSFLASLIVTYLGGPPETIKKVTAGLWSASAQ